MRIMPSHSLLHRRSDLVGILLKCVLAAGVLLASAGCAKFPANGGTQNAHLIFTMTVAPSGHIRNGLADPTPYIYMVAVNPSTDLYPTVTGPEPVITAPWGNGMVAGGATHFIRYLLAQPYPYTVYEFTDPGLLTYGATGTPITTLDPGTNGRTIQFEIDLSQITPNGVQPSQLQSVLVNFLTMDRIPTGNDGGTKFWDALGDSRSVNSINDYVRIPLTTSRTYTNADFQDLEPGGDCPDPDLDIVDWSVQVVKP